MGTKLTRKKVLKAIPGTCGIISKIADICGVHRNAVYDFLKLPENADILPLVEQERERIIDKGESVICEKMDEGNLDAAKFVTRTLGKHRGWSESPQISLGDGTIRLELELVRPQFQLEDNGTVIDAIPVEQAEPLMIERVIKKDDGLTIVKDDE